MISISEKAKNMLAHHGRNKSQFLRITVTTGGCAGMTYDAEIVDLQGLNDKIIYEEKDLTILSNNESIPFLDGLEIDYSDDLISAGFRFNNSTNDSSCGCGASFKLVELATIQPFGDSHDH